MRLTGYTSNMRARCLIFSHTDNQQIRGGTPQYLDLDHFGFEDEDVEHLSCFMIGHAQPINASLLSARVFDATTCDDLETGPGAGIRDLRRV